MLIDRTGEKIVNTQGQVMEIIKYSRASDIDVIFEDGTIVSNKSYGEFKIGGIKNPNCRTLMGIGYIGVGIYSSTKHKKQYETWKNMITRCYDKNYHDKRKTYRECSVCEEWNSFQNFAKWYDDNYYEVDGERMSLDKDFLIKGNKLYSPNTCIFMPSSINSSIENKKSYRGQYPVGVRKRKNGYEVSCNKIYLGVYDNIYEAYSKYVSFKEKHMKEIAERYKGYLPTKVYNAIINYKFEITD